MKLAYLILALALSSLTFGETYSESITTTRGIVYEKCRMSVEIEPQKCLVKVKTPGDEIWYIKTDTKTWNDSKYHYTENNKKFFLMPVDKVWSEVQDIVFYGPVTIMVKHRDGIARLNIDDIQLPTDMVNKVLSEDVIFQESLRKKIEFTQAENMRVERKRKIEFNNMVKATLVSPPQPIRRDTILIEVYIFIN